MSFKLGEKDASHQSQELESSLLSSLQVCWILRPYSHLEMVRPSALIYISLGVSLWQPMFFLFSSKSLSPVHTPLAAFLARELPESGPLESTLVFKGLTQLGNQKKHLCIHLSESAYGLNKGDGWTGCKGHSVCAGALQRSPTSFSRGRW